MNNNFSVIETNTANVKGKFVNVETLLGKKNRQDISYRLNGRVVSYDDFWKLNPEFTQKKG